jgi:hypothetical protein
MTDEVEKTEFTFPDGTLMDAQGRHMLDCYGFFGDVIQGAKGSADDQCE